MKTFAVVLMAVMTVAAIPAVAAAAPHEQQSSSLNGVAQGANKVTLPNYTVQVRNVATGQVAGSTTSSATGTFSFPGLQAGNYVVEIVDAAGKVVGVSSSVSVGVGAAVSVTVTASATGAIAGAAGGGFGLLGLGSAASVAVIGAAGAATALVAVKATASPSR